MITSPMMGSLLEEFMRMLLKAGDNHFNKIDTITPQKGSRWG